MPIDEYNFEGAVSDVALNNLDFDLNEDVNEWFEIDEDEIETIDKSFEFANYLRRWAVTNKISHKAMNELLPFLKLNGHQNLPNDCRSFLGTPRKIVTQQMGNGLFWYGGIKKCLSKTILLHGSTFPNEIKLNFNMDGLPLYKSSKTEFWPILMGVANKLSISPMVVAIYCGVGKPPSSEIYLESFVEELLQILNHGITINNTHYNVSVNAFICDTPARSFIKCRYLED